MVHRSAGADPNCIFISLPTPLRAQPRRIFACVNKTTLKSNDSSDARIFLEEKAHEMLGTLRQSRTPLVARKAIRYIRSSCVRSVFRTSWPLALSPPRSLVRRPKTHQPMQHHLRLQHRPLRSHQAPQAPCLRPHCALVQPRDKEAPSRAR